MSTDPGPQVAWKVVNEGATVFSSDGNEVGALKETAGDHNADIFDGLIVAHRGTHPRYVPAEQVRGIWPDRVEMTLTQAEFEALPAYEEPRVERWAPRGGGFGSRVRAAFRDMFGRR